MSLNIHSASVFWLPLIVTFMGKQHRVEIIGRLAPFCRYFTCRIPGADILILEARHSDEGCKYSWVANNSGHQFNYLVPFIGKEIEKRL